MQIGANVREAVGQVLREIRSDFRTVTGEMDEIVKVVKNDVDQSVKTYMRDIDEKTKTAKDETEQFIQHTVETQVLQVIDKIELLLNQGKSIEDIQKVS